MASTAALSPCTTLRTPAGPPASMNSSASRTGTLGSFSDGFRMKALPTAMATAEHPHRDHRREVERGDAGDDAQRLAHRIDVDARARRPRCTRPSARAGCRRRTRSPPARAGCRRGCRRPPCRARTRAARASSSMCASTRRLNSNITRARRCGFCAAQAGCAASAALHRLVDHRRRRRGRRAPAPRRCWGRTRRRTSPPGWWNGLPSMKWGMSRMRLSYTNLARLARGAITAVSPRSAGRSARRSTARGSQTPAVPRDPSSPWHRDRPR